MNKQQAVTCGHTQYGGYSVIRRLWLVSAFLHLDSDVASKPRTAHTAVRYSQCKTNIMHNFNSFLYRLQNKCIEFPVFFTKDGIFV